jgi:(1->4)-alpha-D-glucan 1-alpha-D-glucosylmutase
MIRATYRLQFHKGFTFSDAAAWAGYFSALGISHIYSSPILTARAGSLHGYDVVDHAHINPELGGERGFRALADALKHHGIGIILDIVPNHMAVGKADNPWWLDLLENGRASRYADYFDIDWEAPGLEDKVFAPFLGEPPRAALSKGDLTLIRDQMSGKWMFAYFDHRFPIRPEDQNYCGDDLYGLLARQNFVLADWHEADARLNWRRFFDITDLAAIRPGISEVFEATHAKILELYGEGLIQGVRVDHVDGIADPGAYCRTLRARLEGLRPGAYIVVEKILAEGEAVPVDWQVDGTTGYDFMNDISALEHRPDHGVLETVWRRQTGRGLTFDEEEHNARREMLLTKFAASRAATIHAFARILSAHAQEAVDGALIAIIARLRCYRSYATGDAGSPGSGVHLAQAFACASADLPQMTRVIEAIAALFDRQDGDPLVMDALRRFSQLSAPVAAKAVEDTAFYRYGRILSRNDVGFDPRCQAMVATEFHRRVIARASLFPSSMLTTATHDHKRGEDARARIAALSHMPVPWEAFVAAAPAPAEIDPADAYQLYQTLVGAWPAGPVDARFAERIEGWCRKYLREAKLRSSWTAPNEEYEARFCAFVRGLILAKERGDFRDRLSAFLAHIRPLAEAHTLLQIVLRNCVPGVPDLYQGCEFEDLSLVDPDNRRPVDFAARAKALAEGKDVKQTTIARLLAARQADSELWARGDYRPLSLNGNALGFSRSHGRSRLIVVARLGLEAPLDALQLDSPFREVLTGREISAGSLAIKDLLRDRPVAVLYAKNCD